jgi:F-type H+-transporting ATPase subunit b
MAIMGKFAGRFAGTALAWFVCAALLSTTAAAVAQDEGAVAKQSAKDADRPAKSAEANDEPASAGEEAAHTAGDAHADAHGHDPYDLSHANASANLATPADIRFDMAIYSAVVFFLLLAILSKFAWGPISHGLEHREKSIVEKIESARISAEKAAEQVRLYEARLAAAADEARQIVAQAHRDAEAAREKIVAEAQASAQKERDRAVADINSAKNEALRQIAKQSVDTAIQLAGSIVRREIRPEEHERLISESLGNFSKLN